MIWRAVVSSTITYADEEGRRPYSEQSDGWEEEFLLGVWTVIVVVPFHPWYERLIVYMPQTMSLNKVQFFCIAFRIGCLYEKKNRHQATNLTKKKRINSLTL